MLFESRAGAGAESGAKLRVLCQLQNPVRQSSSIAWSHREAAPVFINEPCYFAICRTNEECWSPRRSNAIKFAGYN